MVELVARRLIGDWRLVASELQAGFVERLVDTLAARIDEGIGIELRVLSRSPVMCGRGPKRVTARLKTPRAVTAVCLLDEMAIGEAYLDGEIDLEGDMVEALRMRAGFGDLQPLFHLWSTYGQSALFGQARQDEKWIGEHYDEDPDFYLSFLDRRFRCYSHGYFQSGGESLEEATERKLATALEAVGARPGDRVLDIGAGWGALSQFAGERGVRVTSLTISKRSEQYVGELIAARGLPCDVQLRHFLEYECAEPFDAIINLGVTEHLPDYNASAAQYMKLVKPGGYVFLDACASLSKFPFSTFTKKHIWPGNATPLVLDQHLRAMQLGGLEVKSVTDDRMSYYHTCRLWAENLEAAQQEIIGRFGDRQYRRFRLYLWGCAHGFATRSLGAYHLLLQRPADRYQREHIRRGWARLPLSRLLG